MAKINLPKIVRCTKSNEFVGIKSEAGFISLYVPSFFNISSNEKIFRRDVLLFLNSIEIAKERIRGDIKTDLYEADKTGWPTDSYLWLLKDYVLNGKYFSREKVYVNDNKGRIDWKRTLKTIPVISKGNIIYDNLIATRNISTEDIVSQIYMLCVQQSYYKVGWLFGYEIAVNVSQKKSVPEMISIISTEYKKTFDDVKRRRFMHMLKVLRSTEGTSMNSKQYIYGIQNYYYVFERMVDSMFGGISKEELSKFYPNAMWTLLNGDNFDSSNMYPDTINIQGKYYYIIDAKLYQYGFTGAKEDLPKTQSIQKQVTYGDYVKTKAPTDSKIRNCFIMPYNKLENPFLKNSKWVRYIDNNLVYIGNANISWREDGHKEDYDYIHTFLIDFNYLLNNYKKEDEEMIRELCATIEAYTPRCDKNNSATDAIVMDSQTS